MGHIRTSRFKRALPASPLRLTERDRTIIRLVGRHCFLRSGHIVALIKASPQPILRRLYLLYHHGYLERPPAQIAYYHQGGMRPMVYGLGNKGEALLCRERGTTLVRSRSGEKNRAIRQTFLEHALLVSDVMVALEVACRQVGVNLLTEAAHLSQARKNKDPSIFHWKVKLSSRVKLGVIPDRVFALECSPQTGKSERLYFFLEVDRGTMPIIRRALVQTSLYRKLLAYEATWSQSIHHAKFGFDRFRVLTVTSTPGRMDSIIEACSRLKRGRGLFLFADHSISQKPGEILSAAWRTSGQETTGLLPPAKT